MPGKLSTAELEAIRRAALIYLAERPGLPMALNAATADRLMRTG